MRANPFPPLVGQPFSVLSAPLFFSRDTQRGATRPIRPGKRITIELGENPKIKKNKLRRPRLRYDQIIDPENEGEFVPDDPHHPHCYPTFIRVQSALRDDTQLAEEETGQVVSGCRSQ